MSLYDSTYLLIAIVVISLSLRDFLRKSIISDFTDEEFYIYSNIFVISLMLLYSIYLLYTNKCNLMLLREKITTKNALICISASVFSVLASILLLLLLKRNDLSFVAPQINPFVIIMSVLLGVFLANEEICTLKVSGIVLVIIGLIAINLSKK